MDTKVTQKTAREAYYARMQPSSLIPLWERLHMLVPRFRPGRNFSADPSEFVWSRGCQGGRLRSIDTALKYAPIERVDYVWLIDTGLPRHPDPRFQLVWQEGRSLLFQVRPLGFPNWNPKDF